MLGHSTTEKRKVTAVVSITSAGVGVSPIVAVVISEVAGLGAGTACYEGRWRRRQEGEAYERGRDLQQN